MCAIFGLVCTYAGIQPDYYFEYNGYDKLHTVMFVYVNMCSCSGVCGKIK